MTKESITKRPPVVVIMGHIDHGKSTLLDYIRKSNIVAGEAGGITQHLSAYEVLHNDETETQRKITFLDTPGHEAFSQMRERGAVAADIAILVVSAEDSVKMQTKEALATILESKVPYIVAINKIDKPGANIEKTKMDLSEAGVYLEGYGGQIPFTPISAKEGTGIDDLLSTILLVADLEDLTGDENTKASGIVIESNLDPKRGISATLVIKNGTLHAGDVIMSGNALVGTRIVEDFLGRTVKTATFSSPIKIVGWNTQPEVGGMFVTYSSKKEAELALKNKGIVKKSDDRLVFEDGVKVIPLIIKSDVYGTVEAIEKEVKKLEVENLVFKILSKGTGSIGEGDIKLAMSDKDSIILGFNVSIDKAATELNEKAKVSIQRYDIIYKLTDWLKEEVERIRPRIEVMETTGQAKILRTFSKTKERQVIGARVTAGRIKNGGIVRIIRRDNEVGKGLIVGLEQGKIKASEVLEGIECGVLVESKVEIATGDVIESFTLTTK